MNNLELEINNAFKREVINCDILIQFIQYHRANGDEDGFWDKQWYIATEKKLQAQFNIKKEHIPSQQN